MSRIQNMSQNVLSWISSNKSFLSEWVGFFFKHKELYSLLCHTNLAFCTEHFRFVDIKKVQHRRAGMVKEWLSMLMSGSVD